MSVPVISSIFGGVAVVGGGVGIYLTHNKKKKDNKNPPPELADIPEVNNDKVEAQVDKEEVKVEQEEEIPKVQRVWDEIIKSDEYKSALTTGKLLPFVTYDSHEEADNSEKYFLMKISNHIHKNNVSSSDNYVSKLEMKNDTTTFLNLDFDTDCELECEKLPFYFFSSSNVSTSQDLDLNKLQNCSNIYDSLKKDTYVIVFVDKLDDLGGTGNRIMEKNFKKWQKDKPNIKIKVFLDSKRDSSAKTIEIDGQMLQIFNKEYPSITVSNKN